VPTHQGRGAENLLSPCLLIKPGDVVPGNMYFTTTRLHQELAGGTFVDVIIDEAHDPASSTRSRATSTSTSSRRSSTGRRRAHPYVTIGATVNMAGGQPISHGQLRAVRASARHGIRLILDATRAVENAWFIQQREPGLRRQVRSPRSCA
jgi:tyrosine phenol-lyase